MRMESLSHKFWRNPFSSAIDTYTRAHDQTVKDDYFRAMSSVEKRLVSEPEREILRALVMQLTAPEISLELRLEPAKRARQTGW